MMFQFFKDLFNTNEAKIEQVSEPFEVGNTVDVINSFKLLDLDITTGQSYEVIEVSEDGEKVRLAHSFGFKYDIYVQTSNLKIIKAK